MIATIVRESIAQANRACPLLPLVSHLLAFCVSFAHILDVSCLYDFFVACRFSSIMSHSSRFVSLYVLIFPRISLKCLASRLSLVGIRFLFFLRLSAVIVYGFRLC